MAKLAKQYKTAIQGIIAGVFLFGGIGLILNSSQIVKAVMDAVLILKPDGLVFDLWQRPPTLNKVSIYLFNWTNFDRMNEEGVRPRFEEIGPYIYHEQLDKQDVIFNANDTLTYKLAKIWYFDETNSRSLNETIVTANALAAVAADNVKNWNFFYKGLVSTAFASLNVKMHVQKTADELLFGGYQDDMIDIMNQLPRFLFGNDAPLHDKFGWFYKSNGTSINGMYNIGAGYNNQIAQFFEWNYRNVTDYGTGACGEVKGTTGEIFNRPLTDDRITIFAPDLCKYSLLDYVEDGDADGVMCRKYRMSLETFDNGTINKENECFCQQHNHRCVPIGAVDISRCRYGAPAVISFPHFFMADPYYLQKIDGLRPDANKHNFYVYVDPLTGVPVHVHARLQMNMLIQPVDGVTLFEGLPEFYMPVMWFEVDGGLPYVLLTAIKILHWGSTIFITIGTTLLVISLILLTRLASDVNRRKLLLETVKTKLRDTNETEPLNAILSKDHAIK